VVPAPFLPNITGVTIDPSGDIFASYTPFLQEQDVVEIPDLGGFEQTVFSTTGPQAVPGALVAAGSPAALPNTQTSEIFELLPSGQLEVFDPTAGTSSQYDDLTKYVPNATHVYDVQTGSFVNLASTIALSGATYGDFGIDQNSLVVSADSNNWDFVMRLTYGGQGQGQGGVATVLAASPVPAGSSPAPGGVAVDPQGTVLTTLPYVPGGSNAPIHVAVGFNLLYDQGSQNTPAPFLPLLGLTALPDIDSSGITVDGQDNFILAMRSSSLYGGGPGIAHINAALTAYLADPSIDSQAITAGVAYQNVGGTDYLAYADQSQFEESYILGHEIPLFSGQVAPAQLRHAYGVDQIRFPGPGGTTVNGDGTGQTIAIVEEGVDPTLGADLHTFDQYFGIPDAPSFQVVNQDGVTNENSDIVGEASLDVELAHAFAPGASIVVYNAAFYANDPNTSALNLFRAMKQASMLPGVSVVTLSYGVTESDLAAMGSSEQQLDSDFTTPGVTFVAASGDSGIYGFGGFPPQIQTNYPASSPNVVAVGGTSINIDAAGDYPGTGASGEVGWGAGTNSDSAGGSGGGLSSYETEPSWQTGVVPAGIDSSHARAVPDVAMDSGSIQSFDTFASTLNTSNSTPDVGWLGYVGTSAAAPLWAALIAIANQGRVLAGGTPLTGSSQTLPALYSLPSTDFHDIVHGSNGDIPGATAGPGYDLVTGRGTPIANVLVPDLAGYGTTGQLTITAEPPSSVAPGAGFGLTVQVKGPLGNPVNVGSVTVALGNNPGGATLGGVLTVPIVNGVATFSGLTINQAGTGYTLTLSATGFSSVQTTAITVTTAPDATGVVVTAAPPAPVFGQPVTLTATVSAVTTGSGTPTGTVTFTEGTTTLGTAPLTNGVASLGTTFMSTGVQTITVGYSGDARYQPNSVAYPLTVAPAPAVLTLGGLSAVFDGSPDTASVSTSPPGLPGVLITYTQGGIPVTNPLRAGSYTVTATLDNPDYTAAPATGTLVIAPATPTLAWATPADITAGTPLTSVQLNATATFHGVPVSGAYTYSPAPFSVLPVGSGQILMVRFTPTDGTDLATVTTSVLINVVPQPSPSSTATAPVTVQSVHWETVRRSRNRTARVLVVGFSDALDPATAVELADYRLAALGKANKLGIRSSKAVPLASARYNPAVHSVTLTPRGSVVSPKLQLTIVAAGLLDAEGRPIDGNRDGQPGGNFTATLGNRGGITVAVTSRPVARGAQP
jgi:hypothetical protein